MNSYTLATTLAQPYDAAVSAVRDALAEQGFGVLTEIDIKATMKAKLDVEVGPQVILGACRPALAHEAMLAEPSMMRPSAGTEEPGRTRTRSPTARSSGDTVTVSPSTTFSASSGRSAARLSSAEVVCARDRISIQ